jgi:predicted nucleotidyltransferase component of viral defense system
MNLDEIRKVAITALFSDDLLLEKLVLKGGNALRLVYEMSMRTSLDIDVSIEEDFVDVEDVRRRLTAALGRRFEEKGLVAFDVSLEPKPSTPSGKDKWGGYQLDFKLIEKEKHAALQADVEKLRRDSTVVGPEQKRKFSIDMSTYEYCEGKREMELDGFLIYVYPPAMIAVEKLRAICQQMDGYALRKHPAPRARDFYDIHLVLAKERITLSSQQCLELIQPVFAAKNVPLALLGMIDSQREFHRTDWPAVRAAVSGTLEDYDFYFDFVVDQVSGLQSLWVE